jgi:hypothetical protein
MHHEKPCPCQSCNKDGQLKKCAMVCGQAYSCNEPKCEVYKEWERFRKPS